MQKILLLFLVFCSANLVGQTITSDWFLQPGDSFEILQATNPDSISLPKGGVDRIWDFSTLEGTEGGPTTYLDPASLSQDTFFADATVAFGVPGIIELFYQATDDSLSVTGIYFNIGFDVWIDYDKDQGELLAIAPMMVGDTLTHTISGILTDGSFEDPILGNQQLSFEGLGTVYIPNDTIINVAYIKSEIFDQDGITTNTVHILAKNGFRNTIVQITEQVDADTGEISRTTIWQTNFVGDVTSTDDADRIDFVVTADASGLVNILADQEVDANIQLIGMNGQVLQTTAQQLQTGDNFLDFSEVSNSGQYIVFILDKESGQFYTHQIMIAK
jgi:hypothetical protein